MCILSKVKIKKLSDFTTIDKDSVKWDSAAEKYTVTLKWGNDNVIFVKTDTDSVSKNFVIADTKDKIKEDVEGLLNNVRKAVKSINRKEYSKNLQLALEQFRTLIGNIISSDGRGMYFKLVEDINSTDKNFDYYTDEYKFPCYKQVLSDAHIYYFYIESIKEFFEKLIEDAEYLQKKINELKQVGRGEKGQQGATGVGLLIEILEAELKYGNQSQARQEIENAIKKEKGSTDDFIAGITNEKAEIFINQSYLRLAKIKRVCDKVCDYHKENKKKIYQKRMNEVYFYFSDEEVRELEERCRYEEKGTIPIDNMLNYKQEKFPLQNSLGEKLQALKVAIDLETCDKNDTEKYVRFISRYNDNAKATAVSSINKIANTSIRKRIKKFKIIIVSAILILIAVALCVNFCKPDIRYNLTYSYPYSAQSGKFEFRKYDNSGAEIISAIPTSDDGVVEFPSQVELVKQGEVEMFHKDIVAIGSNVFGENADTVKSVVIPASVTSIEEKAFSGCSSLTSVIFEYGSRLAKIDSNAFAECSKLEQIVIPSSVTKIGANAFAGCSKLEQIIIPSSVTEIGENAFAGYNITICCGIEESQAPSGWADNWNGGNVVLWGWIAGQEREVVVDGLRFMLNGSEATLTKYNLRNKTEVKIPVKVYANDNEYPVTTIKDNVFSGHAELKNIIVPKGITSIGGRAFSDCSGLTSIVIPDSVTSIGEGAFSGCSGLVSITIPFVGGSVKTANDTYQYPFGYIFGTSFYTGGVRTYQSYHGSSTSSSTTSSYYYIPSSLKGVTVTGGNILYGAFYNCSGLTSISIPESITSIEHFAFYNCSDLRSIDIPNSVRTIGSSAFHNCSGLESIDIPDSVRTIGSSAFHNCSGLESIDIPDSVRTIGSSAFHNCSGLESVEIPYSVTTIGTYAFYGCSNLSGVYIADLAAWCKIDFKGSYNNLSSNPLYYAHNLYLNGELITQLEIPKGVTSIANFAFASCSVLTSIKIPDSVTNIGYAAFYNCSNLSGVYIADLAAWCRIDFTTWNSNPLYYAHNLYLNDELIQQLVIPEGVISIGDFAFAGCSGITDITIPDSIRTIGTYAFNGCSGLQSVSIQSGITSIGDCAFYGCSGLTSIIIPNSVKSIGSGAFGGCSSLESITIPFVGGSIKTASDTYQYPFGYIFGTSIYTGGVETRQYYYGSSTGKTTNSDYYIPLSLKNVTVTGGNILYGAFYNCSGLTNIVIPNSITSIEGRAFSGCSGITDITIPDSVRTIGTYAFSGCSNLRGIVISDNINSIGNYAFDDCSALTIYCEAESKLSGWSSSWNSSNCPVVWAYRGDVAQYIDFSDKEKIAVQVDQSYDIRKPDTQSDDIIYGVNSNLCQIVLSGVGVSEGGYHVVNGNNSIKLGLKMLQTYTWLGLTGYPGCGFTSALISNDGLTRVEGTTINSTVGHGAVYILITYTDGTTTDAHATDIMNGTGAGTYIDIFDITNININDSKTISEISVHVVYEIQAWWGSFWWQHDWTNWHCIKTLKFI